MTRFTDIPLLFSWKSKPGIARSLAWKVHMRCCEGYREGTKSIRRCVYRKQLDIETLVCTISLARPLRPSLETAGQFGPRPILARWEGVG